jgi:Zn-dependent protease with chaperone function
MSIEIVPSGTKRVLLSGLPASEFQHDLDRQDTEQLKKIKGFDLLVAKFIEYGIERKKYVINMGNSLRVGPRQMPRLHEMLRECCAILDMPEPELYVAEGGVNASTSGHNHPYIVLRTGLLELMDDDEVMYVIAHELGHIKCGHVLYKVMAGQIAPFLNLIPHAGVLIG